MLRLHPQALCLFWMIVLPTLQPDWRAWAPQVKFTDNFFLLRGNHECEAWLCEDTRVPRWWGGYSRSKPLCWLELVLVTRVWRCSNFTNLYRVCNVDDFWEEQKSREILRWLLVSKILLCWKPSPIWSRLSWICKEFSKRNTEPSYSTLRCWSEQSRELVKQKIACESPTVGICKVNIFGTSKGSCDVNTIWGLHQPHLWLLWWVQAAV